jgi:hypothetical protein
MGQKGAPSTRAADYEAADLDAFADHGISSMIAFDSGNAELAKYRRNQ